MAGMEQLEIHSKSYLVRWVNAKPEHTIGWSIHPHKRSINFGLFKHPGHLGGLANNHSVHGLPNLNLQTSRNEDDRDETAPAVVDKLTSIGLKQVIKLNRLEADKMNQGQYVVPPGEYGNYALVFDNTFSKSVSKTVTVLMVTFPSAFEGQIQFGGQLHHSQAMASAMAITTPLSGRRSPKMVFRKKDSSDSLNAASNHDSGLTSSFTEHETITEESPSIHTGVLQKRRRKKHQGYARRFFCLDFTSSTLSYYHDKNSSALRGAIPLALAAIGANARTREISIDSGAEIWHLKASNVADFEAWKKALEAASRKIAEATTPGDVLNVRTEYVGPSHGASVDVQEWARLESILGRIAGTRDSIRRLYLETLSKPVPVTGARPESNATTPVDGASDDYFGRAERRAFWKRKPSTPNTQQQSVIQRSISAQLAVPLPSAAEPVQANGAPGSQSAGSPDSGIQDNMKALLSDLDTVIQDFSAIVVENKQRKSVPKSAVSRMSLHSVDSQEFFDAEDASSQLLSIHDESDEDDKTEVNSETSSEADDEDFTAGRGYRSGSLSSLLPARPKTLIPLPHDPVQRRQTVNAPTVMPPSLLGFLRKNVGKDLSTISMPVSANEPLSLLQRAAEALEYAPLLEKATKASTSDERLLYVTAFVISHLSNARVKERSIRKPFNPMLGETYELVREDTNFRFIAEKVSHRPVQLACYAESAEWSFAHSPLPSQKFWGKSSEIITEGKARLVFFTAGECYSWSAPTCFLRNIIAGEKYVEPVGAMTVLNETTGVKAIVTFKAGGMFSGRSEDVDVRLLDQTGSEIPLGLVGSWTEKLVTKEDGKMQKDNVIWTAGPLVAKAEKHYGLPIFSAGLNEITSMEKDHLPPTDSRLRPDQRALENGEHEKAEELKNLLEEAQRARRRDMEAKSEQWEPRWFVRVEKGDEVVWKLKTGPDGYWEERARGEWKNVVPVLKID